MSSKAHLVCEPGLNLLNKPIFIGVYLLLSAHCRQS